MCRSDAELCRAVLRGLHRVAENLAWEKMPLQSKLFRAALQDLWVCLGCPAISRSCDFSLSFRVAGGFCCSEGCRSCVELPQSCPVVFQQKERC